MPGFRLVRSVADVRLWLWIACACLGLGGPAPALARERDSTQLHVDPGALVDVLRTVSRQTGVQIVTSVSPDLRTRVRLRGEDDVALALARITRGLPVRVLRLDSGFVVTQADTPARGAPVTNGAGLAREATPTEALGSAIVVTGYRQSLREALARKRSAPGIRDVTRAEDIAEFPDRNAAEALQRLPGVAISRDNGEGRQVSLRGLGPLFTRTTLNGIETLATTASGFDSRGSVSRQRRFDYSIFDAGLFSQVEVVKTWDANRDAGGVGGTVSLQTLRPFDRPGNVTLVSAQARTGANAPGVLPQVTAEISRRNTEWGVLLAGSWSRNQVTEYGYRNWDWMPVTFGAANVGAGVSDALRARLTGASGDPLYMARAQTYSTWTNRFERLNVIGSIQHKADNGFAFTLDGVHARLSNARNEYSLAAAGTNGLTGDVTGTQVIDALTVSGNTITSARMSGVDMRTEHKVTRDHTDYNEAVASMTLPLGARTRIEARTGYSVSDFEEPVADKVFLESVGQSFAYSATGTSPHNRYGFDAADPTNWSLMRADTREDSIVNRNLTARLDVVRDLGGGLTLQAGGIYRRFANDGWERRVQTDYEDTDDTALGVAEVFSGRTMAPYVVGNVDATFAATGQNRDLTSADDMPGTDYRIRENTYAGFAMLIWAGAVGQRPLTARLGMQFQRTAIASTGTASDALSLFDVSNHTRHSALLPSFDARWEMQPGLIVRFAASRNVNMPDVADLRAAATIDSTPFGGTITTGNPALHPFTSDALDLAVERYLGRDGYFSLGVFFKRLDSFITSETQVMTYAETGYPLAFLYSGLTGSATYNVVRPINGSGASILGVETAFQHDLRFLPAPFDRLGMQANLTYADGSTDVIYGSEAVELPLIDLSRWAGNATLYYSGRGWDARLAAAYRGTYRVDVGDNGNIGDWIKASVTLDFAAHAVLGPRMQMTLELRNITDAPVVQYTDRTAKRLLVDTRSGRTVAAGLRYRF